MEFESAMEALSKRFGRFHLVTLSLISMIYIFQALFYLSYVFTTLRSDHRCLIPECDQDGGHPLVGELQPSWLPLAVPLADGAPDPCRRFVPVAMEGLLEDASTCSPEAFSNVTQACAQWVYPNKELSIMTEVMGPDAVRGGRRLAAHAGRHDEQHGPRAGLAAVRLPVGQVRPQGHPARLPGHLRRHRHRALRLAQLLVLHHARVHRPHVLRRHGQLGAHHGHGGAAVHGARRVERGQPRGVRHGAGAAGRRGLGAALLALAAARHLQLGAAHAAPHVAVPARVHALAGVQGARARRPEHHPQGRQDEPLRVHVPDQLRQGGAVRRHAGGRRGRRRQGQHLRRADGAAALARAGLPTLQLLLRVGGHHVRVRRAVHQLGDHGRQPLPQLHPGGADRDPRRAAHRQADDHVRPARQPERLLHPGGRLLPHLPLPARNRALDADGGRAAGQAVRHHLLHRHLRAVRRAVPHVGARHAVRHVRHHGPRGFGHGAADAAAGPRPRRPAHARLRRRGPRQRPARAHLPRRGRREAARHGGGGRGAGPAAAQVHGRGAGPGHAPARRGGARHPGRVRHAPLVTVTATTTTSCAEGGVAPSQRAAPARAA